MHPSYSIKVDGNDITSRIAPFLVHLSLTDQAGTKSDEVRIQLDDTDYSTPWPRKGAEMTVAIGYEETGVVPKGTFKVDEVTWEEDGDGATMTISAKSIDMKDGKSKSHANKTHRKKKLGDIVREIAKDMGVEAKVGKKFDAIEVPYLAQTEESPMHLARRLGELYGATATVKQKQLLFVEAGKGETASGQTLKPCIVRGRRHGGPGHLKCRVNQGDRNIYQKVEAFWNDKAEGKRQKVESQGDVGGGKGAGSKDSTFTIRQLFGDEKSAKAAIEAKIGELQRLAHDVNVDVTGDPEILPEAKLILILGRDGVDGTYDIEKVVHVIVAKGTAYTTRIDAKTPKTPDQAEADKAAKPKT